MNKPLIKKTTPFEFVQISQQMFPQINVVPIEVHELIFEERTLMNCFYCGRYNNNWKCPPNIPKLNYEQIFAEYEYACFVYGIYPFTKDNYSDIRTESTVSLHKAILQMESILFKGSGGLCLSYIGGSCKLCKNGCGKDRCNNPYSARMPLEATGINVVASAAKYNITISFPVTDTLIRIGLILW